MTAKKNKIMAGLMCLLLCLSLFGLMPVEACAEGEIGKVLTTLSNVPVAMDGVYSITAATSTEGCHLTSYGWYDSSGNPADGTFGTENYRVEITVAAAEGYYFSGDVAVYLNNSRADYVMNGDGSLTLYRDYAPQLWAPSIIKHPTSEKVEVGELASFVASATYTDTYEWTATSPDGKTSCKCEDLPDLFPGVSIGGDGKEKMNIRNVPAEMDGWTVKCTFSGPGGSAVSNAASIKVRLPATPQPTETPKPTATPKPTDAPEATAKPGSEDDHVHEFSEVWSWDAETHWHECSCGEKTQEAPHSMEWTVVTEATKKAEGSEQGVCSVCGYTETRSLAYEKDEDSEIGFMRYVFIGIIVLIVVIVIGLVISGIAESRRRKRRREARRRREQRDRYDGRY
ncbi:MAG: hypothetical protein ACI4O0_05145 [Candidatus Limivicinus sp.]